VPLKTTFHAIVDGTNGNTYLQPVQAKLFDTAFTASGQVVQSVEPKGHHIQLDVSLPNGRIEHLLLLAMRTSPPVMTGSVQLQPKLDLPAGPADVSDRLYLNGNFHLRGAHFSNENIQSKVDALSMRSQGKPKEAKDDIPDNVQAQMSGNFVLKNASVHLPDL